MLIYLHGFRSSPKSEKARLLGERLAERGLADRLWCRQLPVAPREAIALVETAIAAAPTRPTLVGSSLGGFYAAHLAEKHGLKAALINPAADAPRLLAQAVGTQTNLFTGETFEFTPDHVAQLQALQIARLSQPENLWLLAETADEVLDYRDAVRLYAGARHTLVEGGDHAFRSFTRYLDELIAFALPSAAEAP